MGQVLANISARELLVMARRTANNLRDQAPTATRRLALCKQLLSGDITTASLTPLFEEFKNLEASELHFWIGTFYALLLPIADRRHQAAYFTPPHLAKAVLRLVRQAGFNPLEHDAIDPAAGGAAFLSTLADEMREAGVPSSSILKRLNGLEIDTGLARLSEALIGERLEIGVPTGLIVKSGDSLRQRQLGQYDLVIANPPYGRLSQTDVTSNRWRQVSHPGHINKYALFTELCFRLAKPGGTLALILPSSFIAGPLYDLLRGYIREHGKLLVLGSVPGRHDVFFDVAQDISVLIIRAGSAHTSNSAVAFGRFDAFGRFRATTAAKLPADIGDPWSVPAHAGGLLEGGSTLETYGATVRAGYFVWNREQERLSNRRWTKLDIPLVWAANIQVNKFCQPRARRREGVDFVRFEKNTPAIIRSPAIVMQRTTNNAQKRRLVAARVSPSVFKKWGGFASENHTLVITGPDVRTLNELCLLLNSEAVDLRYRQVSGTASVSATLLRSLDLPSPTALRTALRNNSDPEQAVYEAYAKSRSPVSKVSA